MRRSHPITQSNTGPAATSRSTREVVVRVFRYLRPYPWMAVGTIACALVSLLASLVYPRLTGIVVDEIIRGGRSESLIRATVGVALAFFVRDLFNGLRIWLNNSFEQRVIVDIRREVYGKMQRLPARWFDQRSSGDLMTRVLEDVNSMERFLIDGMEQGVVAVISILGILFLMFSKQPALAWVAMIPLPILAGGALWYTLTAHARYRAQRQASSAMGALLMDNLQGVRQIKSFVREAHEDRRFAERADELRRGTLGVMKVWAVYQPAMAFAAALGTALVLWIGGQRVIDGRMPVGQLIEFLLYLALFYGPVGQLHSLNQMLQAARASGERIFDILDASGEVSAAAATKTNAPGGPGVITYRDVDFEYEAGRMALSGISFSARPGEVVALVGPTGAGKTTLVSLLPRFYTATHGTIHLDDRDVLEISLETLRARIAVVSQEPFLFNGTVRENIAYGRLDATSDELVAAAQAANCHEFIVRLPESYETHVGERGVKLSVGEKQRISIARALLKNAPVLILDEATASVDTGTERQIQEALARLMKGRTSLVIAHRLSTIRDADQILVLQGGRIVQRGNHLELMTEGGLYRKLWNYQTAADEMIAAKDSEGADSVGKVLVGS